MDPQFLLDQELEGVERLLLKTSSNHCAESFNENFCALGPEAANILVAKGLRLVGIDTPSMDSFSSKTLQAHKILLQGGVAILENLDLSQVDEGEFELIALPLKILGGDSSPVRAILRETPSSPYPPKSGKAESASEQTD